MSEESLRLPARSEMEPATRELALSTFLEIVRRDIPAAASVPDGRLVTVAHDAIKAMDDRIPFGGVMDGIANSLPEFTNKSDVMRVGAAAVILAPEHRHYIRDSHR